MPRIHTETCQFCGRHGDVVVVEYPGNVLFWQCAEGCGAIEVDDTHAFLLLESLDEGEVS